MLTTTHVASQGFSSARRIAWAIQRGRAEYWFPWWTALEVRLARWLPPALYTRIVGRYPEMEEPESLGGGAAVQPQADDAHDDQQDAQQPQGAG